MTLRELILKIIHDNSGGIKMTGLITEVSVRAIELSKSGAPIEEIDDLLVVANNTSPFLDFLDDKLKEMQQDGEIGLLTYDWKMGNVVREKVFVYTPAVSVSQTI